MGNHASFGNNDPAQALPLSYRDAGNWEVSVDLPKLPSSPITYAYLLREPDGSFIYDWGSDKTIGAEDLGAEQTVFVDSWNNAAYFDNAFYTEPFQEVLLRSNRAEFSPGEPRKVTHRFKIKAPLLAATETLGLVGSFNGWDANRPILLSRSAQSKVLSTAVDLSGCSFPIEYKYVVYAFGQARFLHYEAGNNRSLESYTSGSGFTRVDDGFARLPSDGWRGAGVAIPVFSLRSRRSFGVGEFTDLELMADWAAQVGLKLIQILPVNDTSATFTWKDSYPYAAISAFALHPIYLDLSRIEEGGRRSAFSFLADLEPERRRLNALPELDYESVLRAKLGFLRSIYTKQRQKLFRSDAYRRFFKDNRHWLLPYAVFCHLRDTYGSTDFSTWPEYRTWNSQAEALGEKSSPVFDQVAFYFFLQFHLHRQLQAAATYAHTRGVILKGDIPIGVHRSGVDAWQQPELYHLEMQAGAPPDAFAVKGQNWGFPTYNWHRMRQDGFAWWKQRFAQMSNYFDAFRIDHILGFFRIWSIPADAVEGIMGHFVPAIPVGARELADRSIPFDRDRFLKPYITDTVLEKIFGRDLVPQAKQFLAEKSPGSYSLKSGFTTQRQIEAWFSGQREASAPSRDGAAAFEARPHPNPLPRDRKQPDAALALVSLPSDLSVLRRLKEGLFDLVSNVLLFEEMSPIPDSLNLDPDLNQNLNPNPSFHFRLGMENTLSFQALDPDTQNRLRDLYIDYFFRRQDHFWRQEALTKLPALKRVTNMLVCGEDLGMVPGTVPDVMRQLGLLSLEVQRMPKDLNRVFSRPQDASYLSVVTPSSHDMSTIRGWWEEDRRLIERFWNDELGQPGAAPRTCTGAVNELVVRQHLASPAMWSIFQLQDLLGMDESLRRVNPDEERINVPAISAHYWQYRMHLDLEALLEAKVFNESLGAMLLENGRA